MHWDSIGALGQTDDTGREGMLKMAKKSQSTAPNKKKIFLITTRVTFQKLKEQRHRTKS